jgi:hypothetical protein
MAPFTVPHNDTYTADITKNIFYATHFRAYDPYIKPVTQLTCSSTLQLDTLDPIPGMTHNTYFGVTSNTDARPKNSTIASKQVQELFSKKILQKIFIDFF